MPRPKSADVRPFGDGSATSPMMTKASVEPIHMRVNAEPARNGLRSMK
jgi:hypothetical protein